ncbi:hypothetical protein LTR86_004456 [Recurvomyces mirabilis]|nr:hypothetical protein LTR86_004456 [Recurvomyces mirabilis]
MDHPFSLRVKAGLLKRATDVHILSTQARTQGPTEKTSQYSFNLVTPPRSPYDTVASYRPTPPDSENGDYDAYGLAREVKEPHNSVDEEERKSIIHIKDAYDVSGEGMLFNLDMTSTFKNVFDAFKTASCKGCRPASGMRFKADARKLKDSDTPATIPNLKHAQTLSVKVYSNGPGLKCVVCKDNGYPSTNCRYLDGNINQLHNVQKPRGRLIRLLFRDPNQAITQILVTSTYQMCHAMGDYARHVEVDLRALYFFFDDEKIAVDDTAEELGMKNNSVIDVQMLCFGA